MLGVTALIPANQESKCKNPLLRIGFLFPPSLLKAKLSTLQQKQKIPSQKLGIFAFICGEARHILELFQTGFE